MNRQSLMCWLLMATVCPQALLWAIAPSASAKQIEEKEDNSKAAAQTLAQAGSSLPANNKRDPSAPLFQPKITIKDKDGKARTAQANPASQGTSPLPLPSSGSPGVMPQLPGRVQGVVPPFQRRPIPAPVGDISVSTTNLRPELIDLGSAERVPRLSLKDAPVKDVLELIARVAGLNTVFVEGTGNQTGATGATATPGTTAQQGTGITQKVTVNLENETAQEVFNNVLRITGLDANRIGRTIFVAARLPFSLKNTSSRSYRLNQITAGEASAFLASLGAERVVTRARPIPGVTQAQLGTASQAIVNTPTENIPVLESVQGTPSSLLPLRGLQVIAEERTNSLTLVGSPSLVDYAAAQLARIDARKRQTSVNVRIVDVNLLRNQQLGANSSFGVNDSFFTVRDGVATLNFGQLNPAPVSNGTFSRPVVDNPLSGTQLYVDPNNRSLVRDPITGSFVPAGASPLSPGDNPLNVALPADQGVIGNTNTYLLNPGGQINAALPGLPAELKTGPFANTPYLLDPVSGNPIVATAAQLATGIASNALALTDLFQYPKQFLARLQASIVSGNAKVLTDPTLTVQESEQATVALTEEVFQGIRIERVTEANGTSRETREPILTPAGLTLNIKVDRIDENGFINLDISSVVSAPAGSVPSPDGVIGTINERKLNSGKIRLRDGQTLVLSGVIQDSDRDTVTKVPFFGDLPIIGALFRNQSTTKTRNEVIIVVTPRIIDDSQNANWGYTYQPGAEAQKVLDSNRTPFQN